MIRMETENTGREKPRNSKRFFLLHYVMCLYGFDAMKLNFLYII